MSDQEQFAGPSRHGVDAVETAASGLHLLRRDGSTLEIILSTEDEREAFLVRRQRQRLGEDVFPTLRIGTKHARASIGRTGHGRGTKYGVAVDADIFDGTGGKLTYYHIDEATGTASELPQGAAPQQNALLGPTKDGATQDTMIEANIDATTGDVLPPEGGDGAPEPHPDVTAQPRVPRYEATGDGLVWHRETKNGQQSVTLTNFSAQIVRRIIRDHGDVRDEEYDLEVRYGQSTTRLSVRIKDFATLRWVDTLGPEYIVFNGARPHVANAIKLLSDQIVEHRRYPNIGWHEIGHDWAYLHAGGGIDQWGAIKQVDLLLPEFLERYRLPDPPQGDELKDAVRATLRLLDVAPARITVPLFCAIYRAPLGPSDFLLHWQGPTGSFKTELTALALRHFGANHDARSLPATWMSTAAAILSQAYGAKDALLVIDDYAPNSTNRAELQRKTETVIRAIGNGATRLGLRNGGRDLRPETPPRALCLSSGENVPRGESLTARMLIIEVLPGEVNAEVLSECQSLGASGVFAAAMSAYIQWLAARYQACQDALSGDVAAMRDLLEDRKNDHRRVPQMMAQLLVGIKYFIDFAQDVGVMASDEAEQLKVRARAAFVELARAQRDYRTTTDIGLAFIRGLQLAFATGQAHLVKSQGGTPTHAQTWGWQIRGGNLRPGGKRIGWISDSDVYLDPQMAFDAAKRAQQRHGHDLAVSPQVLRRHLRAAGMLASTDTSRETVAVRRKLEGSTKSVLHCKSSVLMDDQDEGDG